MIRSHKKCWFLTSRLRFVGGKIIPSKTVSKYTPMSSKCSGLVLLLDTTCLLTGPEEEMVTRQMTRSRVKKLVELENGELCFSVIMRERDTIMKEEGQSVC